MKAEAITLRMLHRNYFPNTHNQNEGCKKRSHTSELIKIYATTETSSVGSYSGYKSQM